MNIETFAGTDLKNQDRFLFLAESLFPKVTTLDELVTEANDCLANTPAIECPDDFLSPSPRQVLRSQLSRYIGNCVRLQTMRDTFPRLHLDEAALPRLEQMAASFAIYAIKIPPEKLIAPGTISL